MSDTGAPAPRRRFVIGPWASWFSAIGGAAALIGITVLVRPYCQTPGESPGGARGLFEVVRMEGQSQARLDDGASLGPKDRLRFVVDPELNGYVLVLARTAAGQWHVAAPAAGRQGAKVYAGRSTLADTFELDGSAGPLHLVAVFSASPLPVSRVQPELEAYAWPPEGPVTVSDANAVRVLHLDVR